MIDNKCPHCGEKNSHRDSTEGRVIRCSACGQQYRVSKIGILQMLTAGFLLMVVFCCGGPLLLTWLIPDSKPQAPAPVQPLATIPDPTPEVAPEAPVFEPTPEVIPWHQGGTLVSSTALQWQRASDANKLASCADILMAASREVKLKQPITSPDRSKAEQLMAYIDETYADDENRPVPPWVHRHPDRMAEWNTASAPAVVESVAPQRVTPSVPVARYWLNIIEQCPTQQWLSALWKYEAR